MTTILTLPDERPQNFEDLLDLIETQSDDLETTDYSCGFRPKFVFDDMTKAIGSMVNKKTKIKIENLGIHCGSAVLGMGNSQHDWFNFSVICQGKQENFASVRTRARELAKIAAQHASELGQPHSQAACLIAVWRNSVLTISASYLKEDKLRLKTLKQHEVLDSLGLEQAVLFLEKAISFTEKIRLALIGKYYASHQIALPIELPRKAWTSKRGSQNPYKSSQRF